MLVMRCAGTQKLVVRKLKMLALLLSHAFESQRPLWMGTEANVVG